MISFDLTACGCPSVQSLRLRGFEPPQIPKKELKLSAGIEPAAAALQRCLLKLLAQRSAD
jgi:hypothetical protein